MEPRLTPAQIVALQQAQRQIDTAVQTIAKLMQCGEACDQLRHQVEQTQAQIQALLTHFGAMQ